MSADEIVISAVGALTSFGVGLSKQLEALDAAAAQRAGSLETFQAARHLADRRVMKAISPRTALGLVALEDCVKQARYIPGSFDPERVGLYIGAPSASVLDVEYYEQALLDARDAEGRIDVRAFGRTAMGAKPTTLLIGLANNVLCYGSIAMDARGANSNYTSGATSGALAVINAARRVERAQIDFAVAGAYSAVCDPYQRAMLQRQGIVAPEGRGLEPADGGAFVALERRRTAEARGARVLARFAGGAVGADALGVGRRDPRGASLESTMRRALAQAGAGPEAVGLVLGWPADQGGDLDAPVLAALSRLFPPHAGRPAAGVLRAFGQRMEASAVLELGLAGHLQGLASLPRDAGVEGALALGFTREIAPGKPYVLVLAGSSSGQHACIVLVPERTSGE